MKKSNKIVAVLLALVTILTTVPMMTVSADIGGSGDHYHAYVLQDGATAATCTEDGVATYKCSCGDVKVSVTEALNHQLVGTYTVKENVHTKYCNRCKKEIEYEHDYKFPVPNDSANKLPTCTEVGKQVYRCSCGKKATKDVDKLNHIYGTLIVDGDKHVGSCITCYQTVTEAHTWDEGTVTVEAKCHADGEKTFHCTALNCTATKTEKIEASHKMPEKATNIGEKEHKYVCENNCGYSEKKAHNFEVAVVEAPTCEAVGSLSVKCKDCEYEAVETIAKAKHTFGNYEKYDADKHAQKCTVCGVESYGDHTWNDGTVTTEPSCAKEGVKTYLCKICNQKKTEAVAKTTEHTVAKWETVTAATCKDAGSEKGTCTVCNGEVTREIPKTEKHTWGEWKVIVPATPVTDGTKICECTVCGDKKTEAVKYEEPAKPKLGDVNNDGNVTAVDARLVLQSVAGLRTLTAKEQEAADMNADGNVTAVDARVILQVVAGLR